MTDRTRIVSTPAVSERIEETTGDMAEDGERDDPRAAIEGSRGASGDWRAAGVDWRDAAGSKRAGSERDIADRADKPLRDAAREAPSEAPSEPADEDPRRAADEDPRRAAGEQPRRGAREQPRGAILGTLPWRPSFLRISLPPYLAFGVREPRTYETREEVGLAIPAATAFLGLMFVCCVLLVAGLPPLPSFVAKFALLASALDHPPGGPISGQAWAFVVAVIANGFAALVALTRLGIRLFWTGDRRTPRLRVLEAAPVALLVALCLALTAAAGPAMSFFEQTARLLHAPEIYMRSVLPQHVDGVQSGTDEP